jgi:hypothetical protein
MECSLEAVSFFSVVVAVSFDSYWVYMDFEMKYWCASTQVYKRPEMWSGHMHSLINVQWASKNPIYCAPIGLMPTKWCFISIYGFVPRGVWGIVITAPS